MTQKLQFTALGTLLLALAGACGESTPVGPSAPPPPSPPGPTTLVVSGFVRTMPGRWCEGCVVEVMDGASAGTSVLTEVNGRYSLSISFAGSSSVTLQASKNGYQPARQTTTGGFVSFTLESSHPLDLTGSYGMRFEVGAQCSGLPESVRMREYAVTLAGHAEGPRSVFVARPVDGTFDAFEMIWRVSDTEVVMLAASGDGGEIPGLVERLGSDETVQLSVFSEPIEITTGASMRIPVLGLVSYCKGASGCTTCSSSGRPHLITMTRRHQLASAASSSLHGAQYRRHAHDLPWTPFPHSSLRRVRKPGSAQRHLPAREDRRRLPWLLFTAPDWRFCWGLR